MTREELLTLAAEALWRAFPDRVEALLSELQMRLWWTAAPRPTVLVITRTQAQHKTESHCSLCARGWEEAWRTQPHEGWAVTAKMQPFALCAVCVELARISSLTDRVDWNMARTEILRAMRAGTDREQAAAEEVEALVRTRMRVTEKIACAVCTAKPPKAELVPGLPEPVCANCLRGAWNLPAGKRFDSIWEHQQLDFRTLDVREIDAAGLPDFFLRLEPLSQQRSLTIRRRTNHEMVLATEGSALMTFAAPAGRMSVQHSAPAGDLARPVLDKWRVRMRDLALDLVRGAAQRGWLPPVRLTNPG